MPVFVFITVSLKDVLEAINRDDSDLSDLSEGEDLENKTQNEEVPDDDKDSDNDNDSDDEPLSNIANRRLLWKHVEEFSPNVIDFKNIPDSVDERTRWNTMDYMKQYLDEEFFEYMAFCTNITSTSRTGKSLYTTAIELQHFIGASILMSSISYPQLHMFWQKTLRLPAIADVISRNRYFQIRSSLKVVVDSDVTDDDKKLDRLWKVRPIMDRVRKGCLLLPRCRDLSIDEQMIPFTGACPLRRYVANKPNPIGLKNYVLASPNGLVLDFIVDQGAGTYNHVPDQFKVGVGGAVIAHLAEGLTAGTHIFCDRYFTSFPLIEYMLSKDIYITGTIMGNRVPR